MNLRRQIKKVLPRTFLGRSVMIIVTPLILLQIVATWVFYDRHWETITRRLAGSVAGEISMVIETMRQFPEEENLERALRIAQLANLQMEFKRGEILPNTAPEIGSGILDRRLSRSLQEQVRRPFHMDSWTYDNQVRIKVQLPDGVLDVFVSRERLFSSTTYIFVMWMVGTSMVLFAIASIFMRNQVRPIQRLARAVDAFGKGRDVSDIRPEGATEIRRAAAAFNLMRDRILRTISQRTEMLAGVSHDLRTPLTRMKLQLAMIGDDKDIGELKADVEEMERMVEEYLAFARGESVEAVVPSDLGKLIGESVSGAAREGIDVSLKLDDDLTIPLRPNAIKRALTNLIVNAGAHGNRVEVDATRGGEFVVVLVDDDGPGIPEEEREEVFKPFYRLDSSRNSATGGTGLGLTIARDLIRGHGGDLTISESPLGGVRARIRLPV